MIANIVTHFQFSLTTTDIGNNNLSIRCNKCEVLLIDEVTAASENPPQKCKHCRFYFCPVCWTVHMEQLRNQLQALDGQLNLVQQRLQKKSEQFEVSKKIIYR